MHGQPAACCATTKCSFWDNGLTSAGTHTVVDKTRHTSPPGWQQSATKINIVK